MDMKWNPIKDGDLSRIPRDEVFIFTIFDEEDGENYIVDGWIEEEYGDYGDLGVAEATNAGKRYYKAENVKAWMDYPPPYNPNGYKMLTVEQLEAIIQSLKEVIKMRDEGEN